MIGMDVRPPCMVALQGSEDIFRKIEAVVPPPQWVPWDGRFNWRYLERLPIQLLIQKLARQISGVRALDVLMTQGFLQEVGSFFRILDEIGEDIMFVVSALVSDEWTEKHEQYCDYLWSESDQVGAPPIRRKEVRAFSNRKGLSEDPSTANDIGRTIHKTYSDFVHARSAPIMGMISGPPPKFHLDGITDVEAAAGYAEQMPAYFYRCLVSSALVARVSFSKLINDEAFQAVKSYEAAYGSLLFKRDQRRETIYRAGSSNDAR